MENFIYALIALVAVMAVLHASIGMWTYWTWFSRKRGLKEFLAYYSPVVVGAIVVYTAGVLLLGVYPACLGLAVFLIGASIFDLY